MNAATRLIVNTQKFNRAAPRPSLAGRQCSDKIPSVCHCLWACTRNGTWLSVRAVPTSFCTSRTTSPAFCWSQSSWHQTRVRRATYGKWSFVYTGPSSWNSLPDDVRNTYLSLSVFRSKLKSDY